MAIIPRTQARLKPYVKIFTTQGDETDLAALLDQLKANEPIGAVQEIDIKVDRGSDWWRELNTESLGKPVEVYPQLPTYELNLKRVVLYNDQKSTMLKAFGFDPGFDICEQTEPLMITVELSAPDSNDVKTLMFPGVWFESAPLNFNIDGGGDLRIVQDVNAKARGIFISS